MTAKKILKANIKIKNREIKKIYIFLYFEIAPLMHSYGTVIAWFLSVLKVEEAT